MNLDDLRINYDVLPHRDSCIRPPQRGNPLYPLPPDYYSLDPQAQRWWRVNACSIQETPEDLVRAYTFFANTYLRPEESLFYENWQLSPPGHVQLIYDIAAWKLNSFALPREFCKTTLVRVIAMLLVLTRRGYRIGFLGPIQEKVRETLGKISDQFLSNPLLLHDFGEIKSPRNRRKWSASSALELNDPFRSRIFGMWLKGASRGGRADWLVIDDAEVDPETGEAVIELTTKLERRVRKIYMPMVRLTQKYRGEDRIARRGMGVTMIGTVIQENMLLARIANAERGSTWDYWNRWRLRQESRDGRHYWWWREGSEETQLKRGIYGEDVFDSEFQNQPGESSAGKLRIDPVFHTFGVEERDHLWKSAPTESESLVKWATRVQGETVWHSLPAWEWLQGMETVIFVDWAGDNPSKTSDYTAIHVMGNDYDHTLWSLDLILARFPAEFGVDPSEFRSPYEAAAEAIARLCVKWMPRRIAMEAVGGYGHVCDMVFKGMREKLLRTIGYLPQPMKLVYNRREDRKGQRIDRIAWRFRSNRIRFPVDRRNTWPYNEAWDQIAAFEPRLQGVRYDDFLDTLGFTPEVFLGPGGRRMSPDPYYGGDLFKLLEDGRQYARDGHSLMEALPSFSTLPAAVAEIIEAAMLDRRPREGRTHDRPRRRVAARIV